LVKSIASQFFDILQKEEAASNTNVFYDPADLTSLRVNTDGSGGNPAVGDPVGIMMDTSQFGGKTAEAYLVGATELSPALSLWTLDTTASESGGRITFTAIADFAEYQLTGLTDGGWYEVTLTHNDFIANNGGHVVGFQTSSGYTEDVTDSKARRISGSGTTTVLVKAPATTAYIKVVVPGGGTIGGSCYFEDFSIKEVTGHHAIAPSDSARPVLYDDPDLTAAALTDNGRGEELLEGNVTWSTADGSWTETSPGDFTAVNGINFGANSTQLDDLTEIGAEYEVSLEVYDYVSGTLGARIRNNNQTDLSASGNGVFTGKARATEAIQIYLMGWGLFNGKVRNISVRKVLTAFDERGAELSQSFSGFVDVLTVDWSPNGAGYELIDNTGGQTRPGVEQTKILAAGTYEMTISVRSITGASQIRIDKIGSDRLIGVGETTFEFTLTSPNNPRYRLEDLNTVVGDGFIIDSISIKQVPYPNLVTNGTFDTDSDWTKGTGWSIGSGVASKVAGTASFLDQDNILEAGKIYKAMVYVSSVTSGNLIYLSSVYDLLSTSTTHDAVGWHTVYIRPLTTTHFMLYANSTFEGSIDNVSVQELPASIDRKYYLDTDGSDDWMEVKPTLNLGEQWWHVGAWKYDAGTGRAFATSSDYRGALRSVSNRWFWYDSAGGNMYLSNSGPETKNVVTIEQSGTNSISARYNGVQEIETQTPYDDSGATQGFALFSHNNLIFGDGLDGRFYGGSWGQGQVDYDELTVLQDYLGTTTQPPIDPPDVTEYADVYELLAAQTGAVLFDINDKTSLRVGRDGSGGVPVDGDPVGMMMDVSGAGGSTMAAYLTGATELVTNGTFDTDLTGWLLSASPAVVGGRAELSRNGGIDIIRQSFATEVGKVYQITADVTGASAKLGVGTASLSDNVLNIGSLVDTSVDNVFVAQSNPTWIYCITELNGTSSWDNVSVKALPGYVATAPSDSARPTLASVLDTTASELTDDGTRGEELCDLVTPAYITRPAAGGIPAAQTLVSQSNLEIGETYEINITGSSVVGSLGYRAASSGFGVTVLSGPTNLTNGSQTVTVRIVRTGNLTINADADGFSATIESVSVKKVNTVFDGQPNLVTNGTFDTDSDWTKGTGWSIGSGVASASAVTASLEQSGVVEANKWYQVLVYATVTSGYFTAYLANGDNTQVNLTGWHVLYLRAGTTGTSVSFFGFGFTGSIDNVIVQEVPASVARAHYLDFDGSDDNLILDADTIAASSNATLYKTFRGDTTDTRHIMFSTNGGPFILTAENTTLTLLSYNVGSPVYREDGTIPSYATRGDVFTALIDNTDHTIGVEEADLSAEATWASSGFYIGGEHNTQWDSTGRLYAWAAVDTRLDGRGRDLLENFMIGKKTS